MPGICGFILNRRAEQAVSMLDKMVTCMLHESFYSSGTLEDQSCSVSLGWVCHAGSFSDCNPIWSESRDITLIFSGENFDDSDQLDARSLISKYEAKGAGFLRELNGVFSGVLIDRRHSKIIIFNDRFGLGRIFFYEDASGFYFASEAKSILKLFPRLRQLSIRGFAEFFSVGCALQNRTLFKNVELMPPASAWTFDKSNAISKATYFEQTQWEKQPPLSVTEYFEKLRTTFIRILPRYVRKNESPALSLTGGLDSRMILACSAALPEELYCYTFSGPYRDCADVQIARRLANVCSRLHKTIYITDELFTNFSTLARKAVLVSDGGMDVTGAVEIFMNKQARRIAPVRMTGNYGSEILRRNVAFKPMPVDTKIFNRSFEEEMTCAKNTYQDERRGNVTSFVAFKQVPWHHHSRWAIEQSQLIPRSPFLDNEIVALAYCAPIELSLNKELAYRFIDMANSKIGGLPTDRGVIKRCSKIGGRVRILSQEFLPKMEYFFDYGMPQWMAKYEDKLAFLNIDRRFLGQQKFYHFRTWYRNQLSNYVKEMLLDSRTLSRPYLNGRHVEKIVKQHLTSQGNYTLEIHKLLTSELIQRELLEDN